MTTYYSAPEPDDLQRRCWITDDGQCRLYNGHEGGHDFGRAEPDARWDPMSGQPPRYRPTMVLDPAGEYVLAHMHPALATPDQAVTAPEPFAAADLVDVAEEVVL